MKETEKFKGKSSAKKILINVGSILILVLAAISFIFIPAMVQSAGNEIPPFGYYDKKPIEYKQGSYFTNLVQMYSDQVGSANVQNAYFDIFNSAFTGSVLNIAFSSLLPIMISAPVSPLNVGLALLYRMTLRIFIWRKMK